MHRKCFPLIAYVILSVWLVYQTKEFSFYDNGDFTRVFGIFFGEKIHVGFPTNFNYRIIFPDAIELKDISSSTIFFGVMALFQFVYDYNYSLLTTSLFGKLFASLSVLLLGLSASKSLKVNRVVKSVMIFALLVITFLPYNIAIFNTIYTEYVLFIAMPMLIALIIKVDKHYTDYISLAIVSIVCGAAKTQFFYIPSLVLIAGLIAESSWKALTIQRTVPLIIAQFICLIPLSGNQFQQLNYYHSTYLGSYLTASDETLNTIGLTEMQKSCIGTDAWGHFIGSAQSETIISEKDSCVNERSLTLNDVLAVYARQPSAFVKLVQQALPVHFTVEYFHVTGDLRYLYSIERGRENGYNRGHILVDIMDIRSAITLPLLIVMSLTSFVFLMVSKIPTGVRSAIATLSLFVISQIVICLLGEGVRDLSRHLSAAQFALDILTVLNITCAVWLVSRYQPLQRLDKPLSSGCQTS